METKINHKNLKIGEPEIVTIVVLKLDTVMRPNHAIEMANSVDPDKIFLME